MNKHLVAITGQVLSSPWGVMRLLGDLHGYEVSTMPMIGLVCTEVKPGIRCGQCPVSSPYTYTYTDLSIFSLFYLRPAGERRTCIFTLERKP